MGKVRQKYKPTVPPSPESIIVKRTTDVTNKCLRALKEVMENRNIDFEEEPAAKNQRIARLRGEGVAKAFDRSTHYILPLFPASDQYWIAVSITFRPKLTQYQIHSVSLRLFRGGWSEERKQALFRAEWDCSGESPSSDHAQPHWQVYDEINEELLDEKEYVESVPDGAFDTGTEELSATQNVSLNEFTRTKNEGLAIGKFHFAMASGWQEGKPDSHQVDLRDIESLTGWLSSCIAYTKRQLVYLSKKT